MPTKWSGLAWGTAYKTGGLNIDGNETSIALTPNIYKINAANASWTESKLACQNLIKGGSLPSVEELASIYLSGPFYGISFNGNNWSSSTQGIYPLGVHFNWGAAQTAPDSQIKAAHWIVD